MLATDQPQEQLIKPFRSKISKKPAAPGSRVAKGEWSRRLDDMGFSDWMGEKETEERHKEFQYQLQWDIAHRNYKLLIPCISIDDEYNDETQKLNYTVDLYGDGAVVQKGQLYVNRGDYLMFYLRMEKHRRKEALISQIALANVGMLVPYVRLESFVYDNARMQVHVGYRIVL